MIHNSSPVDSRNFFFLHSHGGMGCGSAHNPRLASRALVSNCSSVTFPDAYFRYHQHQPFLTSSWLIFVPSRRNTSARVRRYLSWPWAWRITSRPKTNADKACFARVPKAWPFSGQSMPLRRARSGWVLCSTSMLSAGAQHTRIIDLSRSTFILLDSQPDCVQGESARYSSLTVPSLTLPTPSWA